MDNHAKPKEFYLRNEYEKEVEPLLIQLLEKCKGMNLPIFATIQFGRIDDRFEQHTVAYSRPEHGMNPIVLHSALIDLMNSEGPEATLVRMMIEGYLSKKGNKENEE